MSAGRVLVIEDNPQARKMLRVTLESQGCEVLEAGDGHAALEQAEYAPDLILQDLLLPDVEGLELRRLLREHPACAGTPSIAVSGYRQRLFSDEVEEAGFSARLLKPVEPSRLLETIRPFLPAQSPAVGVGARRVLVADDEDVQRKLTVLRLREAGFEVIEARDGREAVSVARQEHPDAIVADVLMPGLDGFEVCRELRTDEALADVRVILASSAFIEPSDRELALAAGADRFVVREPDLTAVIDALVGSLAGRPGRQAPHGIYDRLHVARLRRVVSAQRAATVELETRLAEQEAQLTVLTGFSEALARSDSVDDALDDLLMRCVELTGHSGAAIHALDEATGALSLRASAGRPPKPNALRLECACRERRALAGRDEITVALRAGDQLCGVVEFATHGDRPVADKDLAIAKALAVQIAQAVLVARRRTEVVRSLNETISRLGEAVELRDEGTADHTRRMSEYCAALAEAIGLEGDELEDLRVASGMHDIGKIAIPDAVLLKPGRLTPAEFEIVKGHTEVGHRLLHGSGSRILELAATIAWTHHERWDGSGYPRGLRGPAIPLEGRIAALADVFDALTSDRVYRAAMPVDEALSLMRREGGAHFDPELLATFLTIADRIRDGGR